MQDPLVPITHPSHVRLYVALGVVIACAALFFLFKREVPVSPVSSAPEDTTPLELRKTNLTASQKAAFEQALSDPDLSKQTTLTPKQKEAFKKALGDPSLTATTGKYGN